jgi:hypothetical protein
MRRSTALLPVLLLLAGCGDSTMYYQTRYIPNSDESFTTVGRLGYSADDEVFELPAQPPTLDGVHRKRADCAVPGQKFKPQAKVAYAPQEVHGNGPADGPPVGAEDARMHPVGPDKLLKDVPVAKIENQPFEGLNQTRREVITTGIGDSRPHSTTGAGTDRNPTIAIEASKDGDPYCCDHVANESVVDANGNLIRLAKP